MTRKIGVTARVVDSDGDAGEVLDKRKAWGVPERLVRYDNADIGCQWVAKAGLRLEQWTPAVGDRVRVINTALMRTGTPLGAEGAVTRVNVGDTYFNIDLTHPRDGVIEQLVRATNVEPLPVAQQPAGTETWAPVVGKYGMTRDGRKVGPIRGRTAAYYPFKCDVDFSEPDRVSTAICAADGTNYEYRWLDLIAEWPATTEAAAPVADVEATATKFKVGDRVSFDDGTVSGNGVIVAPAGEGDFDWTIKPDVGGLYFYRDERFGYRTRYFWARHLTLAGSVRPTFSPGQLVTLAAPLEVLGTSAQMAHLRIGANSYTLPIAALAAA